MMHYKHESRGPSREKDTGPRRQQVGWEPCCGSSVFHFSVNYKVDFFNKGRKHGISHLITYIVLILEVLDSWCSSWDTRKQARIPIFRLLRFKESVCSGEKNKLCLFLLPCPSFLSSSLLSPNKPSSPWKKQEILPYYLQALQSSREAVVPQLPQFLLEQRPLRF